MTYNYSLIIPVYNEVIRLISGFSEVIEFLSNEKRRWEIVLIDDGSDIPAQTVLLGNNLLKTKVLKLIKEKKLKIVRLPKNMGKGKAIAEGIQNASGKYLLFMDVDCSVSPQKIPEFLAALKNHPIAIASRRIPGSELVIHQGPVREMGGRIYTYLSNVLCRTDVHDATCGFKGFQKKIGKELFLHLTIYRWSFDAEVLYLARKKNLFVAEIPVAWMNKRGSKVKIGDMAQSFIDLFIIRVNDLRGKYDLK